MSLIDLDNIDDNLSNNDEIENGENNAISIKNIDLHAKTLLYNPHN